MNEIFAETDVLKNQLSTEEMGKYLVLRLNFSRVRVNRNFEVHDNFFKYINTVVNQFCTKYHKAGLLHEPIEIDGDDAINSLRLLFDMVRVSRRQVYLIVDDFDAFTNLIVNGYGQKIEKDFFLKSWGHAMKEETLDGTIARAFLTGVTPEAGLSRFSVVKDLTFSKKLEGMFGLTNADVTRGLGMIDSLTADQRVQYLQQMRSQYEGYRFTSTQTEPMFHPHYVQYFLDHLDQSGAPPKSMIDPTVSQSVDYVVKFIDRCFSPLPLKNIALGILDENEIDTFAREDVPVIDSTDVFQDIVGKEQDGLVALAYYHGFLTFKKDHEDRSILTSPNKLMQAIFTRTLLKDIPKPQLDEIETMICSGKPDVAEIERILKAFVDEMSSYNNNSKEWIAYKAKTLGILLEDKSVSSKELN